MTKTKTKILVFDDNQERREGLTILIDAMETMECVACFSDCRDIIARVEVYEPDVILMDIDMPHVNGIEGTHEVREKFPDLKILMQTVFEDDDKVFAAICAGANGYMLKQADPMKLVDAIDEVLTGGAPMTPVIAAKVLQLFNRQNQKPMVQNFNLTETELEILQYLAKGYSYKMIANERKNSYGTINSHITSIYKKLQVESVGGAIYKAMKEGLVK